jgi:Flp pilus assembly protein TadD
VGLTADAAAQRERFLDGLAGFAAAVSGTYGDEGPQILSSLDTMAGGLTEWDRSVAALEGRVASEAARASTDAGAGLRLTLAQMYLDRRRPADAVRELDAVAAVWSRRADVHGLRALAFDAMGRSAEAARAFAEAWTLDRDEPVAAYNLLRRATPAPPEAEQARQALFRAYERLAPEGARKNAAVFPEPGFLADAAPVLPYAVYANGYARAAEGDYHAAILELRAAAAADPLLADPAAATEGLRLGAAALRAERHAEARAHFESALASAPQSSEAHRLLGLAYWAEYRYDESVQHLQHAVRANRHNERARLALARVLVDAGRDADAERTLRETIEAFPQSGQARWWLGWLYESRHDLAGARRQFEVAAAGGVLAGRGSLAASIGRLARTAGDFPGASEAFETRVGLSPNAAGAHKELAGAYLAQDRVDEAQAELIAAVLIAPDDADARAAIGQTLLDAGRAEEAVTSLWHAIALKPGHAEARYALGMALSRLGRAAEASRELEAFEAAQREAIADRRRQMAKEVQEEEARWRASQGSREGSRGDAR